MRQRLLPLLIVLLSLVLVFIWFREGYPIASGESGLPFYPLGRDYEISINTWKQTSLGSVTSISLVGLPFHYATYQLISIGIPPFALQMAFFFGLIASSALSLFFLVRLLFKENHHSSAIAFLSAVFYIFNFIAINSVWHRLQYPFIFFYALLPISLYFLIKGIAQRKLGYVLILTIVSFVFSMAFASLPMVELFWFIIGLYVLYYIIISRKDKASVWFAIRFFLFFLIAWILTNFWWLLQFVEIFTSTTHITTKAYTVSDNVGTLNAISERLGDLSYIFRLLHKDYLLKMEDVWGYIFYNPIFFLLSFIVPVLAFFPLLIKKKSKHLFYFLGMSLMLLFLTKGTADPFGYVFLSLFERFRFLEAFRNPFEKFGLALPMFYAPLVGYSMVWIYSYFKEKNKKVISWLSIVIVSSLLFFFLVLPMWNGWVFMGASSPSREFDIGYKVEVPQYYEDANNWINENDNTARIISLPISNEGIKYNWKYGYNGGEISNTLFSNPVISYSTATEFQESIAQQIEPTLLQNPSIFSLLSNALNAGYVVVRRDVDYNDLRISNPNIISDAFKRLYQANPGLFESRKRIGELDVYTLKRIKPKIFAQDKLTIANETQNLRSIYSISNDNTELILNDEKSKIESLIPGVHVQGTYHASQIVINSFTLEEPKQEFAILELPFIRFLPDSIFYKVIRTKEQMELKSLKSDTERFSFYLNSTNKRMAEVYKAFSLGSPSVRKISLQEYERSMELFEKFNSDIGFSLNKKYSADVVIVRKLLGQRVILRTLESEGDEELARYLVSSRKALGRLLSGLQIDQSYPRLLIDSETQEQQRLIHTFQLPDSGNYEVFMKNSNSAGSFFDEIVGTNQFQLNDKIVDYNVSGKQQWTNLGRYDLLKGVAEIQIPVPLSLDLLDLSTKKNSGSVNVTSGANRYTLRIKDFDPYGSYRITLEYWLEKGKSPSMQLISSEQLKLEDGKPIQSIKLDHDNYENGWRTATLSIQPIKRFLGQVELSLLVEPFNDCEDRNSGQRLLLYRCENDLSFREGFNRETVFHFKNLRMERIFDSEIILRSSSKNQDSAISASLPEISFSEIDPTHYKVQVRNAVQPYMLVFSESFHPKWALYSDKSKKNERHFLANSFANTWYVDKNGTYELDIRFESERTYKTGVIVSLVFFLLMLAVFFRKRFK